MREIGPAEDCCGYGSTFVLGLREKEIKGPRERGNIIWLSFCWERVCAEYVSRSAESRDDGMHIYRCAVAAFFGVYFNLIGVRSTEVE